MSRVISASDLIVALLKRPSDIIVIDVRDLDRDGGHIRGSLHFSSLNCRKARHIAALATQCQDKDLIVFHCMLSQARGPKCMEQYLKLNESHREKTVLLLDGFENFIALASAHPRADLLLQDLKVSVWPCLAKNRQMSREPIV